MLDADALSDDRHRFALEALIPCQWCVIGAVEEPDQRRPLTSGAPFMVSAVIIAVGTIANAPRDTTLRFIGAVRRRYRQCNGRISIRRASPTKVSTHAVATSGVMLLRLKPAAVDASSDERDHISHPSQNTAVVPSNKRIPARPMSDVIDRACKKKATTNAAEK